MHVLLRMVVCFPCSASATITRDGLSAGAGTESEGVVEGPRCCCRKLRYVLRAPSEDKQLKYFYG